MSTLAEAIARVPHLQVPDWITGVPHCMEGCLRCALDRAYKDRERAIQEAVAGAYSDAIAICEAQRQKILNDPTDPSWTEHLAECQRLLSSRTAAGKGGQDV